MKNPTIGEKLSAMSKHKFTDTKLYPSSSRSPLDANDFISMELIGPFKTTSKGNQYMLTAICMLTNYVICVHLTDNTADVVVNAYSE